MLFLIETVRRTPTQTSDKTLFACSPGSAGPQGSCALFKCLLNFKTNLSVGQFESAATLLRPLTLRSRPFHPHRIPVRRVMGPRSGLIPLSTPAPLGHAKLKRPPVSQRRLLLTLHTQIHVYPIGKQRVQSVKITVNYAVKAAYRTIFSSDLQDSL
eukprot:534915-Pyramimonas_sp.AAC.1